MSTASEGLGRLASRLRWLSGFPLLTRDIDDTTLDMGYAHVHAPSCRTADAARLQPVTVFTRSTLATKPTCCGEWTGFVEITGEVRLPRPGATEGQLVPSVIGLGSARVRVLW